MIVNTAYMVQNLKTDNRIWGPLVYRDAMIGSGGFIKRQTQVSVWAWLLEKNNGVMGIVPRPWT
jgi:hypothetical protein